MTDVITGVAGFIGSHLANRLLADGHDVLGIDCFTDYYDPARKQRNLEGLVGHPRFQLATIDLAEDDARQALEGATCIYHLAAQPGVRGSWGTGFATYVRNNIVATQRLLDVVSGSGARIVFASSSSVYGEGDRTPSAEGSLPRPVSPYGVTKLCSEQLVMAYGRVAGLDTRCVRYFTVFGPRQRPDMAFSKFIDAAIRDDAVPLYGDGEQTRDFTFVSDAVEATIRAGSVEAPGEAIFNVGGGSNASIATVLSIISSALGRSVRVEHLPPQPGDVRNTSADLSRARDVLGWRPVVSLEDGLRAQVDAARSQA